MTPLSNRSLFLLVCDLLALTAAYVLGMYLRIGDVDFIFLKLPFLFLGWLLFPLLFYIFDLYFPFRKFRPAPTLADILISVFVGAFILAGLSYAKRTFILPRLAFSCILLIFTPLVFGIRMFYDALFGSRLLDRKAVIVGTGVLAAETFQVIKQTPHSGIEIVGLVHEGEKSTKSKNGIPVIGKVSDLLSLIDWYGIHTIILAMDPKQEASEINVLARVLERRVIVTSALQLFEKVAGEIPYKLYGTHYLLGLMAQVKSRPYLKFKRIIDTVAGITLLGILSPVLLLAILVLFLSGPTHKIFFFQQRIGRNSVPFRLIKLRSMMENKNGKLVVTRIGRWMRRYRIDEIPQLINVINGDMSLIGPRPEIPFFVGRCRKRIPFYDVVFSVKPGLTGWAQVKFRYTTSLRDYDQKFRYNLYYLKNLSPGLDLLIVLKTIRVVLLGKGQ